MCFPGAYARYRAAEAMVRTGGSRPEASAWLAESHRVAVAIGAAPLERMAADLARRGRLDLGEDAVADGDDLADGTSDDAAGPLPSLSPREREVLALVAAGRTNRQIADELFISPKTASVHVSNILAKLGVSTRGEAAALAHRLGASAP
jgi:DNA-binding CsgD family transcriptional regulator